MGEQGEKGKGEQGEGGGEAAEVRAAKVKRGTAETCNGGGVTPRGVPGRRTR